MLRSFASLNNALGFQELNMGLNNLNVKEDKLLTLVQLMIKQSEGTGKASWAMV